MAITYVLMIFGLLIIASCADFIIPDRQPLQIVKDEFDPSEERILVPGRRVLMGVIVMTMVGLMLLSMIAVMPRDTIGDISLPEMIFAIIGVLLLYGAWRLYRKRDGLVQLELDQTHLYHRPVKWYSVSRTRGGVNAASVFLSKEMVALPYAEIQNVQLHLSKLLGSYIQLFVKGYQPMTLVVMVQNDEQLKEIYERIKMRI